jgi:AAA+ ATPase superfamily predicted ATPase
MFVGRERELKKLEEMYASDKFECAIIYGRRRIGKTTLLNEFVQGKKSIYFAGLETGATSNLRNFSQSILSAGMPSGVATPVFDSYQTALDYVYEQAKSERLLLVIDEYPYLAQSYRAISSLLQIQIDMKYKNSKLFLILCGSSLSFMENQVLGYQSPLYGRRTAQFKLQPFDFWESWQFHPNFTAQDAAVIFGITGGVPHYLAQIADNKTVSQNIISNFLDPMSYLFEEPANLLKQELREPQMYNEIITAIAGGASRLNEISTKVGLETAACSKYLTSLLTLGIVKKERPVLTEKGKKTIYRLQDNMFRFWYRFVPPNYSEITAGGAVRVYDRIAELIPGFMGEVFEAICLQYLWRENLAERLPISFHEAGRWWGNNPLTKSEQEIDIIAYTETAAIFCECKWTKEKMNGKMLKLLQEKSNVFDFKEKYFFLFSRSGFESMLPTEEAHVYLVDFAKMTTQP